MPNQLPSELHVLQFYSHFHSNIPENDKIKLIILEIEKSYEHAGIRTRHREAIRIKLKRLLNKFKDLLSKRKVPSSIQRGKELNFAESILNLFDVAMKENNEQHDIEMNQLESNENYENSIMEIDDTLELDQNKVFSEDPDYTPSLESDEEELPRKKVRMSSEHIEKIYSSTASYRASANSIDVGIELTGRSSNDFFTSKSTIWRKVSQYRKNRREDILLNFKSSNSKIILQFDCKRFNKLNARHAGIDERIIVLSHSESEIPLGLFEIPSHRSKSCAAKINALIDEFNLRDRIVGLICDAENVNIGHISGVCVLVEFHLETDLARLMCRHHIYELVVKSVFELSFGKSVGPSIISIFKPKKEKHG